MEDLCQFYTLLFEANIYNIADVKQDLEKYLDSKNADPVIKQWFMNHYIKHLQKDLPDNDPAFQPHQLQPGDPEWAAKTVDFEAFTEQQEQEILHFIDYFQQLSDLDRSKINKEAYDIIDQKVKDWDTQLASKMDSEVKQNTEGVDYETVMAFPDGYKIVRILNKECRVEEGELMGHCVGGENYDDEDIDIYSLRDPAGHPHVTIEYSENAIRQIKGKQNTAPVAKYVPYIKKWIIDNNLKVDGDGENIGMVRWRGSKYYFKDSKEFQRKYQNEILPAQRELIQEIESKIVDGVYGGDMYIREYFFTELPDWSHLTVTGSFSCSDNQLTSLKGCPRVVGGSFFCDKNQLTSLEGCPEKVGYFNCSHNQLTNLIGGPKIVGGDYYCVNNQLTSLEGCPENVGTFFNCDDNQLTSLKGCPRVVGGSFFCDKNQLTSLEGCPEKVRAYFSCDNNQLTSLEGGPKEVGMNFNCNHNQLTSLKGSPRVVSRKFYCEHNQLTNLIAGPEIVGENYYCRGNPLTSLEGKPEQLGGKIYHDPLPESDAAVMEHYIKYLEMSCNLT